MIPLNKPGYLKSVYNQDYISSNFPDCQSLITATAGDGLNLIYRRLREQRGTLRVAVSPFACFQAIYPIVVNGHTPVFIDIDKDTFNTDAEKLINRKDVDAVELIHLGGNPNQMDVICQWAELHNIVIIEDCAQALGSTFNGKKTGTFGDYAVFSLIKNIHAPIGGLLLSKANLATKELPQVSSLVYVYRQIKKFLESQSNHHTYNVWNLCYLLLLKLKEKGVKPMNDSCKGVGTSMDIELRNTLSAIDQLNRKRLENATYIINNVDESKYKIQMVPKGGDSNRNRLLFRIPKPKAEQTIMQLRKAGIAANNLTQNYLHGFQPHVCKDKWLGAYYHKEYLKCYDAIFNHIIAIPCSPFLKGSEMDYMIKTLNQTI